MHEVGGPPANLGCSQDEKNSPQEQPLSAQWVLLKVGEACGNIALSSHFADSPGRDSHCKFIAYFILWSQRADEEEKDPILHPNRFRAEAVG